MGSLQQQDEIGSAQTPLYDQSSWPAPSNHDLPHAWLFELRKVVTFFFANMLLQNGPEFLELGHVVGALGTGVLKVFEELLDLVMLLSISVCTRYSLGTHVLFEGWVNKEFFCDGVAGKLPGELVAVALLVVNVIGVIDYFIVVGFKLAVILCDGF